MELENDANQQPTSYSDGLGGVDPSLPSLEDFLGEATSSMPSTPKPAIAPPAKPELAQAPPPPATAQYVPVFTGSAPPKRSLAETVMEANYKTPKTTIAPKGGESPKVGGQGAGLASGAVKAVVGAGGIVNAALHPFDTAVSMMGHNIEDTSPQATKRIAADLKARGRVWGGAQIDTLIPPVIHAVDKMQQLADKDGYQILITSGTDSKHTPGSHHYSAGAVDFRVYPKGDPATVKDLSREQERRKAYEYAQAAGFSAHINELDGGSPHTHASWWELVPDKASQITLLRKRAFGSKEFFTGDPKTKPIRGESDVHSLVNKYSLSEKVPSELMSALIQQESGGNPHARSPVGAFGLTQFMPETIQEEIKGTGYTVQQVMDSPDLQVKFGAKYLRKVTNAKGGNIAQGLASYNAGGGNVDEFKRTGKVWREPADYVAKIMSNFDPQYKGKTYEQQLALAKGQILGKIPSPNLVDYEQSMKAQKDAFLVSAAADQAQAARKGASFFRSPVTAISELWDSYTTHDKTAQAVTTLGKAATDNSQFLKGLDRAASFFTGLSPEEVHKRFEDFSNGKTEAGVVGSFLGQVGKTVAFNEEFAKASLAELYNVFAPFAKKATGSDAFNDYHTDAQTQVMNDPNANSYAKIGASIGPMIGSMFLSMGGLTKIAQAGSAFMAGRAGRAAQVAGAITAGEAATPGVFPILREAVPHAIPLMADFGLRGGSEYTRRTMDPNSPESLLSPKEQLYGFLSHTLGGMAEGAVLSFAAPALQTARAAVITGKGIHVAKAIEGGAEMLANPELSRTSKTIASSLKAGSVGFGVGSAASALGLTDDGLLEGGAKGIGYGLGIGGALGAVTSMSPALQKIATAASKTPFLSMLVDAHPDPKSQMEAIRADYQSKAAPWIAEEILAQDAHATNQLAQAKQEFQARTAAAAEQISKYSKSYDTILEADTRNTSNIAQAKLADPMFDQKVANLGKLQKDLAATEGMYAKAKQAMVAKPSPNAQVALKAAESAFKTSEASLAAFTTKEPLAERYAKMMKDSAEFKNKASEIQGTIKQAQERQQLEEFSMKLMDHHLGVNDRITKELIEGDIDLQKAFLNGDHEDFKLRIAKHRMDARKAQYPPDALIEAEYDAYAFKTGATKEDLESIKVRVDHSVKLVDTLADNLAVRGNTAGDPHGEIMKAALNQYGLPASAFKTTWFPDREAVAEFSRIADKTTGVVAAGVDTERLFNSSQVNWGNFVGASGVAPTKVISEIEKAFPSFKTIDQKKVNTAIDPAEYFPAEDLSTILQNKDAIAAERLYIASKAASNLGEPIVPVLGKISDELKGVDEFVNHLARPDSPVTGLEDLGITDAHELFDLSETYNKMKLQHVKYETARRQISIEDGKFTNPISPEDYTADRHREDLIKIAKSIQGTEITKTLGDGDIVAKAESLGVDRLNKELSLVDDLLSQDNSGRISTRIGLNTLIQGASSETIKAYETLAKGAGVTEKDIGTSKIGWVADKAVEQTVAAGSVINRMNETHTPIREAMVDSIKGMEIPNVTNNRKEFMIDMQEVLHGKKDLPSVISRWVTDRNKAQFREYFSSLSDMNHFANAVAKKSNNGENLFSASITDQLYKPFAEKALKQRQRYAGTRSVHGAFEDFGWDYTNPRALSAKVEKLAEAVQPILDKHELTPDMFIGKGINFRIYATGGAVSEKAAENLQGANEKLWKTLANKADAMAFAPFFVNAYGDPLALLTRKVRGAVAANSLGDFLQSGKMMKLIEDDQGSINQMVEFTKDKAENLEKKGYKTLGNLSGAYEDAKFTVDGIDYTGKEIWIHPKYRKAMDQMEGFGVGLFDSVAEAKKEFRKVKDASFLLRSLALLSGASSWGSQLVGKGMSLMMGAAYKGQASLREGGAILADEAINYPIFRDSAVKAGLNLGIIEKPNALIAKELLGNLNPEETKRLLSASIPEGGGGKFLANFSDGSNPLSPTQKASRDMLGTIGRSASKVFSGITAWDAMEMAKGVASNSERAAVMAFHYNRQSLVKTMASQLEGLSQGAKNDIIDKTAAAIVNKNLSTLPTHMGTDTFRNQILPLMSATPGIGYSRMQQAAEAVDFMASRLPGVKPGAFKDFLAKNDQMFSLTDHYGHLPPQVRQQIQDRTMAGLIMMMGQLTAISVMGNIAFNGAPQWDIPGYPTDKMFSIKMGDSYWSPPDFVGSVRSLVTFGSNAAGLYEGGDGLAVSLGKATVQTQVNRANPAIKAIIAAYEASRNPSVDGPLALMNFMLSNMINVKEQFYVKPGGNMYDLATGSQETREAQLMGPDEAFGKDFLGSTKSKDPALRKMSQIKGLDTEFRKGQEAKIRLLFEAMNRLPEGDPKRDAYQIEIEKAQYFPVSALPNGAYRKGLEENNKEYVEITNKKIQTIRQSVEDPDTAIDRLNPRTQLGAKRAQDNYVPVIKN